ncbi:MAG: ABC transporter substrate-binding protein [Chloroflexi bacterium]|nr:ABC transporter substrate-binding protein [Chloroflexota bacterium]
MRATIRLSVTVVILAALLAACAPAVPTAATRPRPDESPLATGEQASKPSAPPAPAAAPTPVSGATGAPPAATKPAAPTAAPAAKIKRGGTLVTAQNAFVGTMDPIFETIGNELKEMALYESLIRLDVVDFKDGKSELRPELAESWERVDPKTIVLKLRKGVKFHDGSEFNAEVAKWSLERMTKEAKSTSKRLGEDFDKLEVVDPYTLRISYKAPSVMQLYNLTMATAGPGSQGSAMLSKAWMDKVGLEGFATNPSGTGPMKLVEWKRDLEFVLSKFDGYWRDGEDGKKLPYLDGIRVRLSPDSAVALLELRAGGVHMTRTLKAAQLSAVKANPEMEVVMIKWWPSGDYFGFNQEKEPFGKNLKLRQAAQYAIDRESLAKVIGEETGRPAYYGLWWGASTPGYDETLPKYEFNLDKATALVKEAGYPNGVPLEFLHTLQSPFPREAEVLQQMWAKAGIKATLRPTEMVAARKSVKAGEFELHMWGKNSSIDPIGFARTFICDGDTNWSNYCNPELDKCMSEGERELDPARRNEVYKRCQRIMYEDALQAGLYVADKFLTYRKEVKGIKMQAFSEDLQEIWLDR